MRSPAIFRMLNSSADAIRIAPNPSSDRISAVASPSVTPGTLAQAERLPWVRA